MCPNLVLVINYVHIIHSVYEIRTRTNVFLIKTYGYIEFNQSLVCVVKCMCFCFDEIWIYVVPLLAIVYLRFISGLFLNSFTANSRTCNLYKCLVQLSREAYYSEFPYWLRDTALTAIPVRRNRISQNKNTNRPHSVPSSLSIHRTYDASIVWMVFRHNDGDTSSINTKRRS